MKIAALAALGALGLAACATAPAPAAAGDLRDPYERFNRRMLAFNTSVDRVALGPAARTYKRVTPQFARDRVSNFLDNLDAPVTFANDLLQAQPARAGTTATRFVVNSTIGVAGLFDPATSMGLNGHDEDFGQTLAVWGIDSGPYLVLPFLGPTTPRDLFGAGVDRALDPLSWVEIGNDEDTDLAVRLGLGIVGALDARARLDEQFSALNNQPEPYVALRRIYSSQRQAAIANGRINEETAYDDLPDFDEMPE